MWNHVKLNCISYINVEVNFFLISHSNCGGGVEALSQDRCYDNLLSGRCGRVIPLLLHVYEVSS
jgi:hypothetical protein